MRHPLHPIRSVITAAAQIHSARRQGDLIMGTTHTSRLAAPPRDPNQLPDGLKDDVGKHPEGEWNDDGDEECDDDSMDNDSDDD